MLAWRSEGALGRSVGVLFCLIGLVGLGACGTTASPQEAMRPPDRPTSSASVALDAPLFSATDGDMPQLPATVRDYQGQTVTVTSVERIVSLSGDVTEIIFALGLGDRVVGVDSSATYPPEQTQALPNIGYQRRLSAEGVLSLNPTLVLGDETAGPPEVLRQMRATGVPVVLVADPPTLASPAAKVRWVAAALGLPERGELLASEVEARIATAKAAALPQETPPRVLFLYLRGSDVQQVAGTGNPADAMIVAAGAINAAAEAGIVEFKPLSPEVIIAIQPDVILVLEKGLASIGGVEGLLRIPGIAATPAGRAQRIVAFDDLYLLGLGPRTGHALADLIAALQTITTAEAAE